MLVLTFSRKAAGELRQRITARLGRTTREPLALPSTATPTRWSAGSSCWPATSRRGCCPAPSTWSRYAACCAARPRTAATRWPRRLRAALGTRGFAEELRDLLLRAAERGLDGRSLARLGARRGRDDWVAAGRFLDRYAARFDLAPIPAYDYAEIVRIAARLLGQAATQGRERRAYDLVLVDEYQDTDPAQEALLHALAGDGRELIVVGDPDQSIYAFRGADSAASRASPTGSVPPTASLPASSRWACAAAAARCCSRRPGGSPGGCRPAPAPRRWPTEPGPAARCRPRARPAS